MPTRVTYSNNLAGPKGAPPVLQKYLTVDQTLHWADPQGLMCSMMPANPLCFRPYAGPVPAVTHLHGAEVPSAFDGSPEAWFTPKYAKVGPGFVSGTYTYPNSQEATTLWYHDHALGTTRLNVYGGLAGFYLLRDARDTGLPDNPIGLPAGPREIELVIQDRMFDTNGQWLFPDVGLNPATHPFWLPEFFGDAIVVNGKTWPYLNVEQRRYRFRFLNGSNARFYQMALIDPATNLHGPPVWQIGTDGGLLDRPVMLNDPALLNLDLTKPDFLLAPGERADVIIDFTGVPAGTNLILRNVAKAPFPAGVPADPQTVGQILQFRVAGPTSADTSCNPADPANPCNLRPASPIVRLADPASGTPAPGVVPDVRRQLVLTEILGAGGPLEVLLNNTKWMGLKESTVMTNKPVPVSGSVKDGPNWVTEMPRVGSTELWEIVNLTMDAHPIHLHLAQFQLLNRQPFNQGKYMADWMAAFPGGMFAPGDGPPLSYAVPNADGAVGGNLPVTPYLLNLPLPPLPAEAGWKDTVVMYPGEVSRILVRWAPQDVPVGAVTAGQNRFPFDPTNTKYRKGARADFAGYPPGPGYVWHCHILDHEDNEMMRPLVPAP